MGLGRFKNFKHTLTAVKRLLISAVMLLLIVQPSLGKDEAKGKWDGGVSLDAGSNFLKNTSSKTFSYSSGGISGWGRYSTDKFMIRVDLQCFSKFSAKSITGIVANANDPKAPTANFDIKQDENTILEEKAGVLMEYTPDRQNSFSFNFKQKWDRQTPDRIVMSIQNVFSEDARVIKTNSYLDIEDALDRLRDYRAEAKWKHLFDKPGRELETGMEWALSRSDKSSTWYRMSMSGEPDSGSSGKTFRFTPLYTGNSVKASVLYRDVNIFDQETLNLEMGADLALGFDRDRLSAANYVEEEWADSIYYRRNFDFLSLDMDPRIKLSYSPGKFNINLQLTPDIYLSTLSGGGVGSSTSSSVFILPEFNASWAPSEMHKLGISYKQGLVRPTYYQLCWFPRAGAYADEVNAGNPDLRPGSNGKASLFYSFHSGFFTGTLEGVTNLNWDKIERVFKSGGAYRIYTWINSGRSFDNRVKLTLKADLKIFNAEVGGYYTYFVGYDNVGNVTRSSDWGVSADAALKIKGGWIFNAKGRYQSKIIRTYSSITEYVGCDVKVTKEFKRFSVYVEGKDLFDRPISVTTYSEDKKYARFEDTHYNRRIFSLGVSLKF